MLQAADREAGRGRVDAALARLAKASAAADIATRRAALQSAARLTAADGRLEDAAEHLRNLVRLEESDVSAWRALAEHLEHAGGLPEAVYAWGRVIDLSGESPALRLRIAALIERYGDAAAQIEAWEAALVAAPEAELPVHRLADLLQREASAHALQHLERIALRAPVGPTSRRLVEAAERLGDLKPALPHVRHLAEVEASAENLRRLARALASMGDRTGAEQAWSAVLAHNGEDIDAHQGMADQLEPLDPARAAPHVRALAERRRDAKAWKRLARLSQQLQDDATAAEAWKMVSDLAPSDMEAARAAAAALGKIDRGAEAMAVMRRYTHLHPNDTKIRRGLLGLAQRNKAASLEIELMGELITRVEDSAELRVALTSLLLQEGRAPEALPHLEALALSRPESAPDQQRYAEALEAVEQLTKAVEAWRAVAALKPAEWRPHGKLASLLDQLGRRAEAAVHMRRMAELLGDDRKSWSRLAARARMLNDAPTELVAQQNVVRLSPDNAEARKRLVELLLAAKRRPEAGEHLEALTAKTPDDAWAWSALADRRVAIDDNAGAVAALQRAVAIDPADIAAQTRLAKLTQAAGDPAAAIAPLKRLIELEPDSLSHADRLAEALLAVGRTAEAMPHVIRVAQAFPKNYERQSKLGALLESQGRSEEAIEAWRPVSAAQPANLEAHEHLAKLYEKVGRHGDALRHLRALNDAKPDNLALLRRLVTVKAKLGSTDDLGPALEILHAAKPTDAPTLRRLASARSRAGDAAGALNALRRLEALKPDDIEVQRDLALVLADLKQVEAAMAAWRAVLGKAPKDIDAHRRLGGLLYAERRRQEALPHIRAVVAQDRADIRSWRRIASIVADDGDTAEQVAAWRDVVAVDPEDAGAHEQLVELLEATDLQAALPHMETVARLTPDKVKPWKRLGKWLQDENRIPEAIAAWSQSLAIAPDDVETHRRLAQLHLLTGDYRAGLRRLNSFAVMSEEPPPALAALVPEPPPLAGAPLVSAVILSLEGAELLEGLFSSFHAHNRYPNVELIVVDHASTDETPAVLDRWAAKLPIRRVMRDANYSYSASCNLGVREAKGDLVLLLNNDVVFSEDVLGEMVRHLTPDVGIVGLKQYNSAPLPEEVLRPYHIGVRFAWDAGGRWFKPRHAIPTASDQLIGVRPAFFPAVTASVMLVRKADYLALGGLDEGFVYGHEDLDFCCKMRFGQGDIPGKAIVSLNNRAAFHPKNSTRRGADAETRAKQGAANEALFKSRWADRIEAEYLGRLFSDDGSYRGRAPAVAFGLAKGADDAEVERAYRLGETMVARFGWKVRYLLADEAGWNDGEGLDAIIGVGAFPVGKVKVREPFVVRLTLDNDGGAAETVVAGLREVLEASVAASKVAG